MIVSFDTESLSTVPYIWYYKHCRHLQELVVPRILLSVVKNPHDRH